MSAVSAEPALVRDRVMWRPLVSLGLSAVGFGLSIYLTYLHYAPQALSCPFGSGSGGAIDCRAVLTSSQSVLVGIPIPFFGLAFFVVMGVLSLPGVWRSTSKWVAWARVGAVVVAMVMVLYLISQEALSIHKLCVWCTSVHLVTFALFLVVLTGWYETGWAQSAFDDGPGG